MTDPGYFHTNLSCRFALAPQRMKMVQVVILSEAKDLFFQVLDRCGRDSSLRSE